ncbi:unnamed protein product [Cuscuta campestris]|uniref:DUF4283 domain-containing protein n=1 Tax=Cuscuta campestris TaxID=132261 RepID=A0A484MT80_9ASTE|nr:unnamed protein product [Cuscuta campestris]
MRGGGGAVDCDEGGGGAVDCDEGGGGAVDCDEGGGGACKGGDGLAVVSACKGGDGVRVAAVSPLKFFSSLSQIYAMENDAVEDLNREVSRIGLGKEDIEISFEEIDAGPRVDLPPTWIIAGRFLTSRPIKFDAMKQVMAMAWKPALGVYVTQDEEGLYLFHFYHVKDAMRIIDEGPWSFDNATLVCKLLSPGEMVKADDLHFVEMWVQIHNLPFGAAVLSNVEPENYPFDGSLRAEGRKKEINVGSQWLRDEPTGRAVEPPNIRVPTYMDAQVDDPIEAGPPRSMSTISWNCRGLGNRRTVQEIADLVSAKKPNFVFLMETKGAGNLVENLRVKIGFDGAFSVCSVGRSGGLALLWKENGTASLLSYSRSHIDILVSLPNTETWRLTGFYGDPRRDHRRESWNLLLLLKDKSPLPWFVIGDFNDICKSSEKRGGAPHPPALIAAFTSTLEACDLFDLGMMGYPFTWDRCHGKPTWVEKRLDRAVRRAPRSFRFENAWLLDDGYKGVITAAWNSSGHLPFPERLKVCGSQLVRWGGDKFNKFGRRILETRRRVDKWRGSRDPIGLKNFNDADADLARLLDQEDVYWRQRAKQHWLRTADANTRFFHQYASHRKKKNRIMRLKDEHGQWKEAEDFGKYLGLPSFIGRNKTAVFSYILDKIRQRLSLWKRKTLSKAGKEVLLKTIAQSMPQFAMSVFLLPQSTCTDIERLMNGFWWDAKLEQYFDAGEVLQIRRVPVNTRSFDGWFWIRDFRGAYMVKSAYRCLMGDASVVSSFSNWGRFWRIPVAPKVLVCLWRAIRDSVWRLMGKGGNRISFISFQNWFQVRCQNDTLLELRTVALTCWAIWKARNIAIWDHKALHPGELKNMVSSMEAQWSNKTIAERGRTPQRHEVSLRAEAYKCFFDAATSVSEESISFGCVLFDPGGAFVAAANGGKLGPLDPLLAEALACKETLSWLWNRGIRDVEILSDCEVLVGAIKQGRAFECYSYLGIIIVLLILLHGVLRPILSHGAVHHPAVLHI